MLDGYVGKHDTDQIKQDAEPLSDQPDVLSSSDRRVIEGWPNRIHDEVVDIAGKKSRASIGPWINIAFTGTAEWQGCYELAST